METEEILAAIQKAADTIAMPNCAAWLSAVAALGTVVVAIIVAIMQYIIYKKQNEIAKEQTKISKKQADISDQQTQIALFDKRYELYKILISCKSCASALKSADENTDTLKIMYTFFADEPKDQVTISKLMAGIYLVNISKRLHEARFLFPTEVALYVVKVSIAFTDLVDVNIERSQEKILNESKQKFYDAVERLEENKITERIAEDLVVYK